MSFQRLPRKRGEKVNFFFENLSLVPETSAAKEHFKLVFGSGTSDLAKIRPLKIWTSWISPWVPPYGILPLNAHKRRMKRYEAPPRHHHSHCIAFCCRTLLASSLIFLPWSRTVHLPLSLYLSRSLYPSFHLLSLLQSFFVFLHRITLKLLSHEGSMMRPECCRSERSRTRTRKAARRGRPSSKSSPS